MVIAGVPTWFASLLVVSTLQRSHLSTSLNVNARTRSMVIGKINKSSH